MKLTGKTKEEFDKWVWIYANSKEKQNIAKETFFDWFYNSDILIQNALIIEFFDSVGLWEIQFYKAFFSLSYKEATNVAIEKANEIFNQE